TEGYVTATNRAMQWRSQVVKPIYESKEDQEIMFAFAKKFGFYKEYTRGMKMELKDHKLVQTRDDSDDNFVWPDDATREVSNGLLSIG
ncbi:formate dehydrogenase, partial [Campylobacter fetus]|nr:formate dehydrogenase [Campylobacter fetus]